MWNMWKCDGGFYSSSPGICTKCFKNCDMCDDNSTCTKCKDGFYRDNVKIHVKNAKSIAHFDYWYIDPQWHFIILCSNQFDCLDCYEGYYLNKTSDPFKCLKCTSNCDTCNATQCHVCSIGYFLDYRGRCSRCESGCDICQYINYIEIFLLMQSMQRRFLSYRLSYLWTLHISLHQEQK